MGVTCQKYEKFVLRFSRRNDREILRIQGGVRHLPPQKKDA